MTDDTEKNAKQRELLNKKIKELTLEHSDLDGIIVEMVQNPLTDLVRLQQIKKRKLAIKDEIRAIHRRLLPDIIA